MDRYRYYFKFGSNWLGLFQTMINFRNQFILHWCWIHSKLHPDTSFGFSIFMIIFPHIWGSRHLILIDYKGWGDAAYLTIGGFFLKEIRFRIDYNPKFKIKVDFY